ncbi:MAG: hypothetical protein ACRDHN_04305 [Thermomicrobiales bacterium]
MRDVSISRRSAIALGLAAAAMPRAITASRAPLVAPPASATKLAEQTVELSDRGVIWQANTFESLAEATPAWPFHAGFLVALETPLTVLDASGANVSSLTPGAAFAVPEQTYLAPASTASGSPYMAIEIVGQDDSDSPYRRPFKADPGQFLLTLWSLEADAGTDGDIASLLAENLPGAPVMVAVRRGGVAISSAKNQITTQILQGSWDAIDTDSVVTVPGGVTAQLLIATIASASQGGGDDDLGGGSASASTTSSPSSIVTTSLPGIVQVNYRTASLDAGDLSWEVVSGLATQQPEEIRYQRGFILALNGAIALTEEDGTFRRLSGANAITVRNGDRFSAQSLTTSDEPFISIGLLAAEDAADPGATTFLIADGKFTFELWRVALLAGTLSAFESFMLGSPFPVLIFMERGELRVTPAGEPALSLASGSSRIVAPAAKYELTGTSASILIARLTTL